MMAGLYLTLRGTPIMYYGEEIGMKTTQPTRKEDVKDPIGVTGWPKEKGRDGERTPMQWSNAPNAGFSTGTPWLPVPPTYVTHNVQTEAADPNSIFTFYKKLLALRHYSRPLLDGQYIALNDSDPNVLSYLRSYKGEAVLVAINMSGSEQRVSFDLKPYGFSSGKARTVLSSEPTQQMDWNLAQVSLKPLSVYIATVAK